MKPEDIEAIEVYLKEQDYPSVGFFLASHKRLLHFCRNADEELEVLNGAGDLE